jgi:hypothetical protein
MLLQFSVANFTSIKDEIILNMIPAKSSTMKDHIISDNNKKYTEVLPVATIYGANASGKTNLLKAVSFAQELVLAGTHSDSPIRIIPHLLDTEKEQKPSRFEFIFKYDGIVYTYGFMASANTVHEEWLFAYYTSKESLVFERITKNGRTEVKPGPRLVADVKRMQFIDFVAQGTRPNQLFLTEANEKNISLVKPVIQWFKDNLNIIWPDSEYRLLTLRAHKDQDFISFLSKFLQLADTGITGLHCESEEFDPNKHLKDIPAPQRQEILDALGAKRFKVLLLQGPNDIITISRKEEEGIEALTFLRLKTEHARTDGSMIDFDLSYESDGTRRLMHLVPMLQDILNRDNVFFIDELDRSLHTLLARFFIQTCIAGVKGKQARGQLIMTTHDTNLLDRKLLRRDEIWFMEKDNAGASHLTSLAEYRVSEGLNYANGYLQGRFEAIPFIGDPKELLSKEEKVWD